MRVEQLATLDDRAPYPSSQASIIDTQVAGLMDRMLCKIIVVGGGICGLTTAIALRAPNREILVLEQSRMNKEVGALISLQPNASRIADKLGITRFLKTANPSTDTALHIYDTDGNVINIIPFETKASEGTRLCFHRMDLHDGLKQAATADDGRTRPAQIRVASKVASCDAEKGAVILESGEKLEADLIIGADGIHSVCRKSIYLETEDPRIGTPKRTGISAYRLLLPTSQLIAKPNIKKHFDPIAQVTSMMFGHDQRVIMGPARCGEIFGICALVPDAKMNEDSNINTSWIAPGSLDKMLETFSQFPQWLKDIFSTAAGPDSDLALWQLRDIDPLPRWSRGRLILVGDAAHAMLPTQGQGASQSFEDAEAIGAFLNDIHSPDATSAPRRDEVESLGKRFFKCRYERVSLIQQYSRQQGQSQGADASTKKVKLNPGEFLEYNTKYYGAKEWESMQGARLQEAVH